MSKIRAHLTFANTVALIALFFALGGPSMAADAVQSAGKLVTGKQVKNGSLSEKDLSSKARAKLKGRTGAQGAAGPAGPAGPAGAAGASGANGSPDTAQQVLDKIKTVDGSGSGLAADLIDGLDSVSLQQRTANPSCPAGQFLRALAASGSPTCSDVTNADINDGTIREQDVGTLSNGLRGNNIAVVSFVRPDVPIPSIPPGSCLPVNDDSGATAIVIALAGDFVIPLRPVGFPDALSLEPTVNDTDVRAVYEVCNRSAAAVDPPDTFDIGVLAIRPS